MIKIKNKDKDKKKLLVLTGGGDCPGLNAVLRALVRRARTNKEWAIYGSKEAFNGVMKDPQDIIKLSRRVTAGIHVKGGTILKTTNRGNPINYPVKDKDGNWTTEDRSDLLLEKLKKLGIDAVINIGGDGSQRISQHLFNKGLNIIGVPKTIDNDLSSTDVTFGFKTAVQIATDAFDKLVTTAESHHRVMILEVMGRDAGWIALYTAIAGGAEVCLIPEIPYDINKVVDRINSRYRGGKGFVNIVVAEGAKPVAGNVVATDRGEIGAEHVRLGGLAFRLSKELKEAGCKADIRETVLGHVQRGGTPVADDRVLATMFGVRAFEMVENGEFGRMVAYKNNDITTVPLKDAVELYNFVEPDCTEIKTARGMGMSFGD